MKRIGTLVLGACIAAMTMRVASAGAAEGSWYVSPSVYALWLDDARAADDDAGISLSFGRVLNKNGDLELGYFGSEHDRATDENLELQGFMLQTKRVFYREGRVNPFISLGVAQVKSIIHQGPNDDDFAATYGVGLLIDIGGSRDDGSAMQLRADRKSTRLN